MVVKITEDQKFKVWFVALLFLIINVSHANQTQDISKSAVMEQQKNETLAKENKNVQDLNTVNGVSQTEAINKQSSENIIKHGIEFSINELNSGEVFDVRKVVSQDEIDDIQKVDKEYFNKKYLNKGVVIIGPLDSIIKLSNDYKLTINKFAKKMFDSETSCDFQKDQTENLQMFLQLLTTQNYSYMLVPSNRTYVLIKGTMTSDHSMKNCKIIGLAKTK